MVLLGGGFSLTDEAGLRKVLDLIAQTLRELLMTRYPEAEAESGVVLAAVSGVGRLITEYEPDVNIKSFPKDNESCINERVSIDTRPGRAAQSVKVGNFRLDLTSVVTGLVRVGRLKSSEGFWVATAIADLVIFAYGTVAKPLSYEESLTFWCLLARQAHIEPVTFDEIESEAALMCKAHGLNKLTSHDIQRALERLGLLYAVMEIREPGRSTWKVIDTFQWQF